MESTKKQLTIYQMAATALVAAVLCILGPLAVPIGPVPISLTNLVALFGVCLLGTRLGTASMVVYLMLGAVGLPVFSGYGGGLAKLAGPTGGYLIGFVFMALIAGVFFEKSGGRAVPSMLGMALGTLVDYVLGTAWFIFQMKTGLWQALCLCVFPFVIGDAIKIAIAYFGGTALRRRLAQAGVLRNL